MAALQLTRVLIWRKWDDTLELVEAFTETEAGKGSDALDRKPQLAAALAAARRHRGQVPMAKLIGWAATPTSSPGWWRNGCRSWRPSLGPTRICPCRTSMPRWPRGGGGWSSNTPGPHWLRASGRALSWATRPGFRDRVFGQAVMVSRASCRLGAGERLIVDAVWQRVLAALAEAPHMRLRDPDNLRRFVGACCAVLGCNCMRAELGCLVPSAGAAKKRFRRWARKGVRDCLMQRSQPVAQPDVPHIDNASIECRRAAPGACSGAAGAIGRSRSGLTSKERHASRFAAKSQGQPGFRALLADLAGLARRLPPRRGADGGPATVAGGRRQRPWQRQAARPPARPWHRAASASSEPSSVRIHATLPSRSTTSSPCSRSAERSNVG